MDQDELQTVEHEWRQAREQVKSHRDIFIVALFVVLTAASAVGAYVASLIGSGVGQYVLGGVIADALFVPFIVWARQSTRAATTRSDEVASNLERELLQAVQTAKIEATQRAAQVQRQEFQSRLANALEMAEGEPEVIETVERAFSITLPTAPIEMLLADNSHAHLVRMAMSAPNGEAPNCNVDSPDRCPAARRAQVQRFADSEALDACPKLRERPQGRCSAVCVPVSIMGRTVGVIHTTGEHGSVVSDDKVEDLATLANLAGARIGLLRVMSETQLQAATDSLTGLLNRRALENKVHLLRMRGESTYSVVMADIDHFKQLNDTHGHETGDHALRLFAQTLRHALRAEDLLARHGGEEFVAVLPACTAEQARRALDAARDALVTSAQSAGLPPFTASFGVVQSDEDHDEELPNLIGRADVALFEAKRNGRNCVVVHNVHGQTIAAAASEELPRVDPDARDRYGQAQIRAISLTS